MTNLMQASNEWATRPDDERFWTLDEMWKSANRSRMASRVETWDFFDPDAVRIMDDMDGGLALYPEQGKRAGLTHFAFGQLCRTVNAPASYLRSLPATLAADCLHTNRIAAKDCGPRQMLIQANESLGTNTVHAMTSERYSRIWNEEIITRLIDLEDDGWRVPVARPVDYDAPRTRIATEDDVIDYGHESALTVKVGDLIGPAGLYASDHDMFAFLINPHTVIDDGESPGGLRRGTMIRQSEVGDCAIWKMDFLFNTVCGNHIVWGAQNIRETRVRHVGSQVGPKWQAMVESIEQYANSSAEQQESEIRRAKEIILGDDRDSVVDFLFGKRLLSRKNAEKAYDMADAYESVHGNPRSVWGMVQGVTRLSQDTTFGDSRATLDMAAGKILAGALSLN